MNKTGSTDACCSSRWRCLVSTEDSNKASDRKTQGIIPQWVDLFLLNSTYSEVIIHVAGEDGAVIVWPLQIGWLVICILSKLFLELLLVVDNYVLAFGLQEADECLDDSQSSASERDKDQHLTYSLQQSRKKCIYCF